MLRRNDRAEKQRAEDALRSAALKLTRKRAEEKALKRDSRATRGTVEQRSAALRESWEKLTRDVVGVPSALAEPVAAIAKLSDALAMAGLPAYEAIPIKSLVDMRRSLMLVLNALQVSLQAQPRFARATWEGGIRAGDLICNSASLRGQVNCNKDDILLAENSFRTWTADSWVDPVSGVTKQKPNHGWTLEQYAQPGFAVSWP